MECDNVSKELESAELRALLDFLVWGEPIPDNMQNDLYAKLDAQRREKS